MGFDGLNESSWLGRGFRISGICRFDLRFVHFLNLTVLVFWNFDGLLFDGLGVIV